ncbi:hypothetical protein N8T08_003234 [Aspergillus melleus]|uniref:Uncharacterized protein n=1 Tax=Aspergillus melleus TaxID=138277 RepID=A0ACC3B6U5_9EURO|nr:hypothetical protein N8T08_003234 [Aspergillus melleus]
MSALDPCKPIDEPIDGPVLPFKYRNSWEIMLFIDISHRSMEQPIGDICNKLCNKLEQHRKGKQDALGEIAPGRTRLALTFHLSELPPPRDFPKMPSPDPLNPTNASSIPGGPQTNTFVSLPLPSFITSRNNSSVTRPFLSPESSSP